MGVLTGFGGGESNPHPRTYHDSIRTLREIRALCSGGTIVARPKLKGIDGRAPQVMEYAAQFDPTRENLPGPDIFRIDRLKFFLDCMVGSAWPFLVGGLNCLLNCVNERDLDLLIRLWVVLRHRRLGGFGFVPDRPSSLGGLFQVHQETNFLEGLSVF